MTTPAQTPSTLDEALRLIALQHSEITRLHAAHASWMRAVVHDLRAPLRHVVSFAPLLKESVQELAVAAPQAVHAAEDAQEFAATMEQSARKMSAMLEGMAQVARAARMPLQMGVVDAAALVQSLAQAFPQVQWSLPTHAVPLLADSEALRMVLQALLDNAVKFSAQQMPPRVTVQAQQVDQGWRLEVQDNGAGFDDGRAQALGELFQRMHRDSEFDGVGCGLAIVNTLVQRHGARWGVQSQPQAGCTVYLEWPRRVDCRPAT